MKATGNYGAGAGDRAEHYLRAGIEPLTPISAATSPDCRCGCYCPTRPSTRSRSRSAWLQGQADSSVMWTSTERSDARAVPVDALDAEVGGIGGELLREGDLVAPGAPGVVHDRWVSDRVEPVTVRYVLRPVQRGRAGLRHRPPEPVAFHVGHVTDQTEQGHLRAQRQGLPSRSVCRAAPGESADRTESAPLSIISAGASGRNLAVAPARR